MTAVAPLQPGRDEDVSGRLRPAGRGGAPGDVAGLGPEPVLGLGPLAGQVALRVQGAARLAGGPRGEDDQRPLAGIEVGRLDRGLLGAVLVHRLVDLGQGHRLDPAGKLGEQLLLAHGQGRVGGRDPQLEVVAPQLRVAGQRDRAHAPAGEHREHPLDPVADQHHHRIAAPHAPGGEGAGEPGADRDQLAEVPDPQLALAVDRDQGPAGGGEALEHVLDEVHGGEPYPSRPLPELERRADFWTIVGGKVRLPSRPRARTLPFS